MSKNGQGPSSPRPSPARRMAMAKVRSMRRARSARGDLSGQGESSPTSPAPSEGTAVAIGNRPTPWSPDLFNVERAAYAQRKPDLLREAPGKYVVFVGEAMVGPFDDFPSALEAARRAFGFRPIYTKQVLAEEPTAEAGTVEVCLS